MRVPHPIPYQGSKRSIADVILRFFPDRLPRLVEPFVGSGAVSIAAAIHGKAGRFLLNDINHPLMDLWDQIINAPEDAAKAYEQLWNQQLGREKDFYSFVRDQFNKTQRPDYFLYLLARCVKASVRYNSLGEFNQSPDNRRRGRRPNAMRSDIRAVSKLFRERVVLLTKDYREILELVCPDDLVYMDPPYQGVSGKRDPRYRHGVRFEDFASELEALVLRDISFIVSYDGRRGGITYGKLLPQSIGVHRLEVRAGRSAQSTLLGGHDTTYESLYLSRPLINRLGLTPEGLESAQTAHQMKLDFESVQR